ncbi:MAG: beta-ketoacyl-ACP synthase II [Armatimonadetes bacterium]|nr:beta-ketoacyl-ACP synthase II [Armatimonadota bacterium]
MRNGEEPIVITGMGVVSPVGNSTEEFWSALCQGQSGISPITLFDTTNYPTRFAGEVKGFDPTDYMDRKESRRMDRFVQFAVAAARMAVADARLIIDDSNSDQVGVVIGSGIGGIRTLEDEHTQLLEKGPDRVSPFLVPMLICDMAAGHVSIVFGAKGPNTSVVTACASAAHSIGLASDMIRRGDADVVIAGGAEAGVTPIAVAGFCAMKALSRRNDDPARASRPFDAERDGFVIAEGAGLVILESLSHARKRGAPIHAELAGYGMSGDACHMTAMDPKGDGALRAMRMALRRAHMDPTEVDYINAHGTSTLINDKTETLAIKNTFGDHARKLCISSTKSMTGHLLGASGGIEAVASILTIRDGVIPPTINYQTSDPECDLDYVPNTCRHRTVNVALSNSFGFGGHNASLIIRRFEEE